MHPIVRFLKIWALVLAASITLIGVVTSLVMVINEIGNHSPVGASLIVVARITGVGTALHVYETHSGE